MIEMRVAWVIDALHPAAALGGRTGTRRVDENPPHRAGGNGQEVATVLPVHHSGIHQAHVRVVHERGCVPASTGSLFPNVPSRQLSEVVVEHRGQPLERLLIPASPGHEQRGDVRRRRCRHE